MQGKKIVELVNRFESFYAETGSDDIREFSVWLNRNLGTSDKSTVKANKLDDSRTLVWNIHRLSKYFRWYSKGFLNANGLNSMDEYFFLIAIGKRGNPTKSEVYKDTLSELTTGTQMMKRLIEIGLVKEIVDKEDKRVRRVKLTSQGIRTKEKVFQDSQIDLQLKLGNLNPSEIKELLRLLSYLENFHGEIYREDGDKNIIDLIQKYIQE